MYLQMYRYVPYIFQVLEDDAFDVACHQPITWRAATPNLLNRGVPSPGQLYCVLVPRKPLLVMQMSAAVNRIRCSTTFVALYVDIARDTLAAASPEQEIIDAAATGGKVAKHFADAHDDINGWHLTMDHIQEQKNSLTLNLLNYCTHYK